MAGTSLDTSVIIAGLLDWHEAHSRAHRVLQEALSADEPAIVPIQALLEAYSVMTRLPQPRRLTPSDAWMVLEGSLRNSTQLVSLSEDVVWSTIQQLTIRGFSGGIVYDAFILACSKEAGATTLWTLNVSHFEQLLSEDEEIEIREPEDAQRP